MPKTVRFLIGPPNAGKTTARESMPSLAVLPHVDLADTQEDLVEEDPEMDTLEMAEKSYELALLQLLDLLVDNDDVLFEHTLVKSHRRPYYVDAVRKRYPDARLICYYVYPDVDTYIRQSAGDEEDFEDLGNDFLRKLASGIQEHRRQRARDIHAMFDIPTESEGFDEIVKLG